MNRNLKILIILVLFAGGAFWLISKKPWNAWKAEKKDFSIRDTAAITRMFFADNRGHQVLLERNEQHEWIVNHSLKADPDKINLMLATMHDVEVRNPITEREHNTVISILATEGIKAEFYEGKDLVKTIYVGSSTPDQTGTYMLIDGSSTPFITHINGFVGYLTPRFITEEKKWKTKEVFDIPADEIRQVSIDYPAAASQSFIIENGINPVLKSKGQVISGDVKFLKYYLGSFRNLFFEGYDETYNQAQQDSVHKLTPYCVISVTKGNGEQVKLQVNLKAIDRRTMEKYDRNSQLLPYDTEKYYAFLDNDKEMVIIQQYAFGRLFRTLDEIVKMK